MRGLVQRNSEDSGKRRIEKQLSSSVPHGYVKKLATASCPFSAAHDSGV
jgi:hypothetical protein